MSRLSEMQHQFREKLKIEAIAKANARSAIPVRVGLSTQLPVPTRSNGSRGVSPSPLGRAIPELHKIPVSRYSSTKSSSLASSISSVSTTKSENGPSKQSNTSSKGCPLSSRTTRLTQSNSRLTSKPRNLSLENLNSSPGVNGRASNSSARSGQINEIKGRNRPLAKKQSSNGLSATKQGYPCKVCGRVFSLQDRLDKHEVICEKGLRKRRKPFDSTVQRFNGLPKDYVQSFKTAPEPLPSTKNSSWREQHEYFIATIRAARNNEKIELKPPPQLQSNEQCKFCSRRFNDDAIKRHEPICEKVSKKSNNVVKQ